jgi:hypothetical protein
MASNFRYVENLDARQSTFNQSGRDINYYFISISPRFEQNPHPIAIDIYDNLSRPASGPDSLSQGSHMVTDSSTDLDEDTTIRLIDQISRTCSNNRQDFAVELESLRQTLALTKLATQKYANTPLGQSLTDIVSLEIKLCSATLRNILDNLDSTCVDFHFPIIGALWHRVWQVLWDGGELAAFRNKLANIRYSLQVLLFTIHSYVLPVLTLNHTLKYFRIR